MTDSTSGDLTAFELGRTIGRIEVHLDRMKQICDETETDDDLCWLTDTYKCAVCGAVHHVQEMLQPTGRDNGDLVCSESCAWDYNELASEKIHGDC